MVGQGSHGAVPQPGETLQGAQAGRVPAKAPEMAIHQQETPAIRQGIVKQAWQRSEPEVPVFEHPSPKGEAEGGQIQSGFKPALLVLEKDPAPLFGQGSYWAGNIQGVEGEADLKAVHNRPRFRKGRS